MVIFNDLKRKLSIIHRSIFILIWYEKSLKDKFILAEKRLIVINVILRQQTKPD